MGLQRWQDRMRPLPNLPIAPSNLTKSHHYSVQPHQQNRLQRRKDRLREDEGKLRKSLKDYDKYLRENDLRRKRAQKKTKHELEECAAHEKEIERLRDINAAARELRDRQRAEIKTDEVYETCVAARRCTAHGRRRWWGGWVGG
jgi:hypothetical protein